MKYNTFWGYVFWAFLLISTLTDLRPFLINIWGLVYAGSIGGTNWILWVFVMAFLTALIVLKISLLRWLFPRSYGNYEELFGTKERCMLCGGLCTWYSLILLGIVIFAGGLKTFHGIQVVQMIITMLTPFIFIYYLVREGEP